MAHKLTQPVSKMKLVTTAILLFVAMVFVLSVVMMFKSAKGDKQVPLQKRYGSAKATNSTMSQQ